MAVALELDEKLLSKLDFSRQVVGVKNGGLVTRSTPPNVREWELRDTRKHGLRLRVTAGSMTWTILKKHQGKLRRWSLDAFQRIEGGQVFHGMTLKKAREAYEHVMSIAGKGHDPVLEKRALAEANERERTRVGETFAMTYVAHCDVLQDKGSPRTDKDRRKVIKWLNGSPLWRTPMANIDQAVVTETYRPWIDHIKRRKPLPKYGPKSLSAGTLRKLVAYPSACWKANATRLGVSKESPFDLWRATVDIPKIARRQRLLDTDSDAGRLWLKELVHLQEASLDPRLLEVRPSVNEPGLKLHTGALIDFYLLVLLWGTRKSETAQLRWRYIDLPRRYLLLPGEITKSKEDGVIPITPWALQILSARKAWNEAWRPGDHEDWVFPSRERGKPINNPRGILETLQKIDGLREIVVSAHDLRRTLATEIGQEEIDLQKAMRMYIVGQMLHHRTSRTHLNNQVTSGYVINPADERRADALRPMYQERENRLRMLVGLKPLGDAVPTKPKVKAAEVSDYELVERVRNDPALLAKLLASMTGGQKER